MTLRSDEIMVRPPTHEEIVAVSHMLGEAMSQNPNHVAVYGPDRESRVRRHSALMRAFLRRPSMGPMLAAFSGATPVGFIAATVSPDCQPSPSELVRMLPGLLSLGPRSLLNLLQWQRAWQGQHPPWRHLHVGPLAVSETHRRAGIGGRLLSAVLADATRLRLIEYLETDRDVNVEMYRKAGFVVRTSNVVLGQPNWYMIRTPSTVETHQ